MTSQYSIGHGIQIQEEGTYNAPLKCQKNLTILNLPKTFPELLHIKNYFSIDLKLQ